MYKIMSEESQSEDRVILQLGDIIEIEAEDDDTINKKILSLTIFNDKTKLQKLNKIIHPIVEKKFDLWCQNQNKKMVVKESALLFESKSFKKFDKIIYVYASQNNRIKRVKKRDSRGYFRN